MSTRKVWHLMDETERRKWQNPEEILQGIGLKPGMTFLDIGCGGGFFTIPAARLAGANGKVYGLDINNDFIERVRQKAAAEGLHNLELKSGPAEDSVLCQACADIVFFGIVLHDFQSPIKVLQNARRMLKPGGILADLDWQKKPMDFGPPLAIRFDEATTSGMIESTGFKVDSVKNSGKDHYLILAHAV